MDAILKKLSEHQLISIFGAPRSGKSYLLNYLAYLLFHRKLVDCFILFSDSFNSEKNYGQFEKKFRMQYSEDKLRNFLKYCNDKEKTGLVLFDDVSSFQDELKKPLVHGLFSSYRHKNVYVIIASQYSVQIPTLCRQCSSIVISAMQKVDRSLNHVYEQVGAACEARDLEVFKELLNEATDEKFFFLYVDCQEGTFCSFKAGKVPQNFHIKN